MTIFIKEMWKHDKLVFFLVLYVVASTGYGNADVGGWRVLFSIFNLVCLFGTGYFTGRSHQLRVCIKECK